MTAPKDDYFDLAPAYVNGTLSEPERLAVERAAKDNPKLAAEIGLYRKIAAAVKAAPAQGGAPSEFAWRRLSRDINKASADGVPANANAPFWRYAAAVLGVVVIAQAVALTASFSQNEGARYATAGAQDANAPFTAKVDFTGEARADDIDALLRQVNADIISGPSARGLYQLRFDSASARDSALAQFKQRSDLVAIAASE